MSVEAGPGPDRERIDLTRLEKDLFDLITERLTRAPERLQLSHNVSLVRWPLSNLVIDAYQHSARRMWRTALPD